MRGRRPPAAGAGPKPTLVLRKARRILDAFTDREPELTIGDIRDATALPVTTCVRLVANLVEEGLLDRSGDRYRIGLGVLRWSAAAVRGLDVIARIRPLIDGLRDETGESAAIFVRQGLSRTCVAVAPTRQPVIWQLQVGLVTPLHVGSGARAMLAFDPAAIDAVAMADRARFTEHTIVDKRKILRALAETRRRGVAISHQELDDDVAGISSPVFAAGRGVVASMGVAGPAHRFDADAVARHVPCVIATARQATVRLGGEWPVHDGEAVGA